MRLENLEKDVGEGYKVLPNIDRERYTEMPGLEGPFQTSSGKPIYYDPKEGAYYDRDTDMYLTYDEFKKLDEGRLGFKDIAKFGDEMAMRIDIEARRRGSADMEPGDADELRYKIAKEMGLVEADKSAIDAAVAQAMAPQQDTPPMPRPKARPMRVPRPKPRPAGIRIGGMPDGSTRGIDPKDNYSPEDLKRLLMQSAMERLEEAEEEGMIIYVGDQKFEYYDYTLEDAMRIVDEYADEMDGEPYEVYNADGKLVSSGTMRSGAFHEPGINEGEAGDHDRMYKVVHAKKGVMDIKAKTSYEAAKKFAKEKGLKSTAGVDAHLYPLEEGTMSDIHAMISNADDPEEMVMDLVDKGGPLGQFLYSELEQLATEAGTTFNNAESLPEDFVDELLANMGIEGYTFEGVAKFYDEYDTPVKVEVTDDKILYNGNDVKMYNWSVAQSMLTPQMYKNAKSWDEVHAYLKRADDKGQLHQAIRATFETNPESITSEGKNKMGPQGIKPGDRVEHEGDMHEVIAVDGYILTVVNLQTGNRTQVAMDDVTRLFGMDAMTDQDKEDAEAMFKRLKKAGSGSLKHTATEGNSPHKKGTKKYKAHMAAMHANSVDLNSMRNALKLDESTDANTVIAQYTRTTLDPSYKSWDQVKEQVNYIKSFVKESDTVNTNRVMHMLSKINLQEKTDKKLMIKEDIDKLRQIVQDKSAMSIKFKDGSMKVDMTTANIFLQAYDRMKERNQMKIQDMMQTKAGFLRVLDFIYGAMK